MRLRPLVALVLLWTPISRIATGSAQALAPIEIASPRTGYAGDASCLKCHRDQSAFEKTGHHLTSQIPTPGNILGSFAGNNSVTIVDPAQNAAPGLQFVMEARPGGYFETAISGFESEVHKRGERIDLITGSGVRGQTYLFWNRERLFELPVSYWTDGHRWINSPGYIDGTADFSRPINPACMECHATYIRPLSDDPKTNRYERESFVPGISCETCHGPGSHHVEIENARLTRAGESTDILNPARFSRDRQVDLCAECHNGIQRQPLAPAFSYVPGMPLGEYFKPLPGPDAEHPDVHGNQVGLLQRSKCYRSSAKMNCSTCHDVHGAGKPVEYYSAKCLECHQWQSCGMAAKLGHEIAKDCVNCHMPVEETNVIVSQTAGQVLHARMRNHWIKVYPTASGTTGTSR